MEHNKVDLTRKLFNMNHFSELLRVYVMSTLSTLQVGTPSIILNHLFHVYSGYLEIIYTKKKQHFYFRNDTNHII